MKLSILTAAITALALAGAAMAQPDTRSGPVYGYQAPYPQPPPSRPVPYVFQPTTAAEKAALAGARQEFDQACAADRASLCAGKSERAMGRCLTYHRLKLSPSCKRAMTDFTLAQQGRL